MWTSQYRPLLTLNLKTWRLKYWEISSSEDTVVFLSFNHANFILSTIRTTMARTAGTSSLPTSHYCDCNDDRWHTTLPRYRIHDLWQTTVLVLEFPQENSVWWTTVPRKNLHLSQRLFIMTKNKNSRLAVQRQGNQNNIRILIEPPPRSNFRLYCDRWTPNHQGFVRPFVNATVGP